jgi:hypothetical protein
MEPRDWNPRTELVRAISERLFQASPIEGVNHEVWVDAFASDGGPPGYRLIVTKGLHTEWPYFITAEAAAEAFLNILGPDAVERSLDGVYGHERFRLAQLERESILEQDCVRKAAEAALVTRGRLRAVSIDGFLVSVSASTYCSDDRERGSYSLRYRRPYEGPFGRRERAVATADEAAAWFIGFVGTRRAHHAL